MPTKSSPGGQSRLAGGALRITGEGRGVLAPLAARPAPPDVCPGRACCQRCLDIRAEPMSVMSTRSALPTGGHRRRSRLPAAERGADQPSRRHSAPGSTCARGDRRSARRHGAAESRSSLCVLKAVAAQVLSRAQHRLKHWVAAPVAREVAERLAHAAICLCHWRFSCLEDQEPAPTEPDGGADPLRLRRRPLLLGRVP